MTLETIDLSNGTARRLLSNEEMKEFLWLPQGRILYTACRPDIHGFSCNYWEMRVNPDTGEPLGGQRPLTQWAGFYMANTGGRWQSLGIPAGIETIGCVCSRF